SSRRRHTRFSRDWSSDVCSSDLTEVIDRIGRHHGQSRRTEVPARRCSACRHALTASLPATKIHSMSLPRNLPKSPFTFGLAAFRSEERRVGKEVLFRRVVYWLEA